MWASGVWLQLEKNVNSPLSPFCTAAAPWFVLPGHAVPPLWLCKSDAASQEARNKLQIIQEKDMILVWWVEVTVEMGAGASKLFLLF